MSTTNNASGSKPLDLWLRMSGHARRSAIYIAAYLLLLCLVFVLAKSIWQPLDYLFFNALQQSDTIALEEDFRLIDVPYYPEGSRQFNRAEFRRRVIGTLKTIDEMIQGQRSPEAVILDITFSADDDELDNLGRMVDVLRDRGISVYAVFNLENRTSSNFDAMESQHALAIYDRLDGGYLHTEFEEFMGVITYKSQILIRRADEDYEHKAIEALPLRIAIDHGTVHKPKLPRSYVLPLGQKETIDAKTLHFIPADNAGSAGSLRGLDGTDYNDLDINDFIILVASTEGDVTQSVLGQSGPQHVAWAIDDQRRHNKNARVPLDQPGVTLGLVLFVALLTTLIYAVVFKYIKRLQTSPISIGIISAGLSVVFLFALSTALLTTQYVIPIGLPLCSILVCTMLITLFARRFVITGVAEGSGKYDVFISYSRKDAQWVDKNLYQRLKMLRKADGSELKIFYDIKEISLGEPFTARYSWAIVDARFFMPVFTENYYHPRSHGRNEMDLADKRRIEGHITILPVAFSDEVVPAIFSKLNYVNVGTGDDAVDKFTADLTAEQPVAHTAEKRS